MFGGYFQGSAISELLQMFVAMHVIGKVFPEEEWAIIATDSQVVF